MEKTDIRIHNQIPWFRKITGPSKKKGNTIKRSAAEKRPNQLGVGIVDVETTIQGLARPRAVKKEHGIVGDRVDLHQA